MEFASDKTVVQKINKIKQIPSEKLHAKVSEIVMIDGNANNAIEFPVSKWKLPPQPENYLHGRRFDVF